MNEIGPRQKDSLNYLAEEERLTPAMLADELGVTRQRAHSILTTLVDRGHARKVAQGLYTPIQR